MSLSLHYHRCALLKIAIFTIVALDVYCLKQCALAEGGGICPDHSKCCQIPRTSTQHFNESGCIPFSHHTDGPGQCCHDDYGDNELKYGTGCAGGFICAQSISQSGEKTYFCEEEISTMDGSGEITAKKRQPRYFLFSSSRQELGQMYGFPVKSNVVKHDDGRHILAYYSTMGFIELVQSDMASRIEAVLIVIHGSGRNADDYLYAGMASANLQTTYPPENVLVVAPRFLAREDGDILVPVLIENYENDLSGHNSTVLRNPMKWNVKHPIPHTWRYGANALPPSQTISSYDGIDALVEYFEENSGFGRQYANLKRIIVAGHSAGGQFTHRWALTSNSPSWGDEEVERLEKISSLHTRSFRGTARQMISFQNVKQIKLAVTDMPKIRVIAANPRSYCYLDGRRLVNGTSFEIPSQRSIDACPNYNTWEWGLDKGGELSVPYRDEAIKRMGGDKKKLAHRYSKRDVVYLSGGNDTDKLLRNCEADDFEGSFRRERSLYYFLSLEAYFGRPAHKRLVVENVGHDHALMLESSSGLSAMFG